MKIENSSPLAPVKLFQLEIDHLDLQLLITKVILALELASLEPVDDDPTWIDTSGIPK